METGKMIGRKQNPERMQRQMFQDEMQYGREQEAMSQAVDDNVFFHQKEGNDDLTKWQQDLKDEVEMTIKDFRREVQNEDGEWERMTRMTGEQTEDGENIYEYEKPMMNELGINMFRAFVRPCMSRNLIMSNYNEDRIYTKLRSDIINYINHLGGNYMKYGIEKHNLSIIVRMLKDIIEPAHWRSLNNGERSYLNTINKRVEAFTYGGNQQQQQKKGFLGGLIS
jgi:hypothetical protein